MQKTTLSSKGQAIIPIEIRRQYNLKTGSKLEWMAYGLNSILIKKSSVGKKPSWDEWLGKATGLHSDIWNGVDPVKYTRELRDDRNR